MSSQEELNVAVQRAVQSLPDRCREVFELSRVHGLKYAEIARQLGISVKTVEAQMGKALAYVCESGWLRGSLMRVGLTGVSRRQFSRVDDDVGSTQLRSSAVVDVPRARCPAPTLNYRSAARAAADACNCGSCRSP